jgi:phenylacetate-coenzyme A ligase PaaK-like adenylate-forming protein
MAGSTTRAELEAAKQHRFRSLVRHASMHAPYYANIIRERGLDLIPARPLIFRCSQKPC